MLPFNPAAVTSEPTASSAFQQSWSQAGWDFKASGIAQAGLTQGALTPPPLPKARRSFSRVTQPIVNDEPSSANGFLGATTYLLAGPSAERIVENLADQVAALSGRIDALADAVGRVASPENHSNRSTGDEQTRSANAALSENRLTECLGYDFSGDGWVELFETALVDRANWTEAVINSSRKAVTASDPAVRSAAASRLIKAGGADDLELVKTGLKYEKNRFVRAEIVEALRAVEVG